METPTLNYIYDPLCGWCYGAAPLVKAAREVLTVRPHGGGMMAGPRRRAVTPELRDFILPHDRRIAQLTGQRFGDAYAAGLLCDFGAVFDSEPPIAAMLAAEALGGYGLDLVAQLQIAHFVEGRRIADRPVLIDAAAILGLGRTEFAAMLDETSGAQVQAHMRATQRWMGQLGAEGFPTFVLDLNGSARIVDVTSFFGNPTAFKGWLHEAIA